MFSIYNSIRENERPLVMGILNVTPDSFFESGKNYFAENISAVAATNPQVLIVSDQITQEQLAALGFAETEAYISGNIYYVDIQSFENVSAKSIKTLMGIANSVYGSQIQPPPAETE